MASLEESCDGATLNLGRPLVQWLGRFPRSRNRFSSFARPAAAVIIRCWLRAYHRLEIIGAENLPRDGSFVMVSNHASHLDPLCLLSSLPLKRLNRTYPAAAAEYFFKNLPRLLVSVLIFNALPFHRSVRARKSLRMCRRLLANPGNVVILFPEGTRSTSGDLSSFKPGIGLLLAGTNVPVVPCFIDGAREALPKGAWLPAPWKIRCVIGPARTYEAFAQDKESLQLFCADLRLAVLRLDPSSAAEPAECEPCMGGA